MMNNAKIGVALVGGYFLGRTKKAKMAIGLGMFLAGQKLNLDPKQLGKLVANSPVLGSLNAQVREELVDATKSAATSALTQRISGLTDSLHERTLDLNDADSDNGRRAEEPADEAPPEDQDEPGDDTEADDAEQRDAEDERPAPRRKAPAKSAKSTTSTKSAKSARPAKSAAGKAASGAGTAASGARKSAAGARKTAGGAARKDGAARRTADRGGRNA
ncbi:hypothetical protein ACIQNI_14915 [Streptomyces sp. NPDC091266]|uniref:hypothetical protein n=1 Tax=Streptomyces sp. NPDC091266 TaxID=3365978 RepID=UPI00380B9F88